MSPVFALMLPTFAVTFHIAIFIAMLGLIGVLVVWGIHRQRQRQKMLGEWAAGRGWSFQPTRDRSFDERHPAFKCLRQGSGRYAYNRAQGRWGERPFEAFDYHYETHSTDAKGRSRTHHHHFSGIVVESALPLKELFIRPEGFFDKVTEFFGLDDIDFESSEFSRRFYVKASERRWAYDVLHQRTMERLLNSPAFTIQFDARHVMAWRSSCFTVAEFESAARVVTDMLDGFPDYLVRQQTQTR